MLASVDAGHAIVELHRQGDRLVWTCRTDDKLAEQANQLAACEHLTESDGEPVPALANRLARAVGGKATIMVAPSAELFYRSPPLKDAAEK